MALIRWDPARELDSLQSDVNRLFDTFFQGSGRGNGVGRRWVPAMDLAENDESLILRVDLPGLDKDDVNVEVKDNVLTVSGERRAEHEDRDEGYYRIERSFGRFARSLDLPKGIDPQAVTADFSQGVLEVRIPKPEERKPTRIEVGSGKGAAAIEASGSEK